jgi:hypothetical protein
MVSYARLLCVSVFPTHVEFVHTFYARRYRCSYLTIWVMRGKRNIKHASRRRTLKWEAHGRNFQKK